MVSGYLMPGILMRCIKFDLLKLVMLLKPLKPQNRCICCRKTNIKKSKEHLFPQWLIKKTGTDKTTIQWLGKWLPPLSCTLPICEDCNNEFNKKLEQSFQKIFSDLESGRGISDNKAELLVRWMWKTYGIAWCVTNSSDDYTHTYNLRERALYPINNMRGSISIAISLIENIDSSFSGAPMGFDSVNNKDCIFVSGVFSKIAIMVFLDIFVEEIPSNFCIYRLFSKRENFGYIKTFYPKVGFKTCTDAVGITRLCSIRLSELHDNLAFELIGLAQNKISKKIIDYRI